MLPESPRVCVMVVEDESELRTTLEYNLSREGYRVVEASHGQEALEILRRDGMVGVIISDVMMPVMDGVAFVREVRSLPQGKDVPFLFLTARHAAPDRIEGLRAGADDYITKPFDLEELLARVAVHARRAQVVSQLRDRVPPLQPTAPPGGDDLLVKLVQWEQRYPALAALRHRTMVGASPAALQLLREVLLNARGSDPVLVAGGTGAGKTGVAEALWRLGSRADRPFLVINCAELGAADPMLTQGKLFGYGKGHGLANIPKEGQPGALEDAHGGTLFLDEIHQLPTAAQAMLLMPLEGRAFNVAAGKADPRTVDVRFIFATNLDLAREATQGRFPQDLYQRLSASVIHTPDLASRRQDVPALVAHFVAEGCKDLALPECAVSPDLMAELTRRPWPGNIRELRNTVRQILRRAAFEEDAVLMLSHLPEDRAETAPPAAEAVTQGDMAADASQGGPQPPWVEPDQRILGQLRRYRFKLAATEQALGLAAGSKTLSHQLRGLCCKALAHTGFDVEAAAALVVGSPDRPLLDRTEERMRGYLDMVASHAAAHTTPTLFRHLPRDYRRYVQAAVDHVRAQGQAPGRSGAREHGADG